MIRSMVRPMVTSMIKSMVNPNSGAVKRYFIDLDPVLNNYFKLTTPETMAGDFELEENLAATAAVNQTLFGQESSALNYFKILSTDFPSLSIDGSVVTSTVAATTDGKLRLHKVKLSGNDFIFSQDGIVLDTVTDAVAAAKTLTLDTIGTSNAADFIDGIPANPKFTDLSASPVTTTFKLDRPTGNVEYSQENTFGAALPELTGQAGITTTGTQVSGSQTGFNFMTIDSPYVSAATGFQVVITNASITGDIRIRDGSGDLVVGINSNTVVNITPSDSTFVIQAGASGFSGSFDIEVREISSNAVTYIGIPTTNREEYQLSQDETQLDNISPPVQVLPAIIEIA